MDTEAGMGPAGAGQLVRAAVPVLDFSLAR